MQLYSIGAAQVGQINAGLTIRRVQSLPTRPVLAGGGLTRAYRCIQRLVYLESTIQSLRMQSQVLQNCCDVRTLIRDTNDYLDV